MTEKRYKKSILRVIRTGVIDENNNDLNTDEVVDLLNELHEENQHIKQTIKTMMENERTHIGKSVLKQLWEAIQ